MEDEKLKNMMDPDDLLHVFITRMYGHRTKTFGFFGDFIKKNSNQLTGTVKDILIGEPREMFLPGETPFMTMEKAQVQQLFQEMWDCGFRPEINKDSAGAFEAQGSHLKDMQKIAFASLSQLEKRNTSYLVIGSSGDDQSETQKGGADVQLL